jgi:enoyl-CoA hydratase/carnithine racemase
MTGGDTPSPDVLAEVAEGVATVTLNRPGSRNALSAEANPGRPLPALSKPLIGAVNGATGNFIDAPTALTWGLVNRVVPHEDLLPAAQRIGADIVSNDTEAVRVIYSTYREGSLVSGEEAWQAERRAHAGWRDGTAGIDPAEVARRRENVQQRGRSQVS